MSFGSAFTNPVNQSGGTSTPAPSTQQSAAEPWKWATPTLDPNGGPKSALLSSKYRDVLYGAGFKGNVVGFSGELKKQDKVRSQVGTAIASTTQQLLRQMYPNATQAQIDEAAWRAMTEKNSGPAVRVMWDGKLIERRGGFDKSGGGYNPQANPVDIARRIGSFMDGGLPQGADAYLGQVETKLLPEVKKWEKVIDKNDDANSGISGFLNKIGPIGQLAISAFVPGGAMIVGAANAAAGLEDGNMRQAVTGAVGAYMGYQGMQAANAADAAKANFVGPTQPPSFGSSLQAAASKAFDPATLAKGAGMQYLATGKIDPKGLITGAVANTVGGAVADQVGYAADSPYLGRATGAMTGGLIRQGLKEDPNVVNATPPQPSGGTTTPPQQTAQRPANDASNLKWGFGLVLGG